ncbi:O-linked N-acetylglucosamine transferase, SPINDLY family protein [Azospirillum melinis]
MATDLPPAGGSDGAPTQFDLGLACLRRGRAAEALPALAAALLADLTDGSRSKALEECLLSFPDPREGIAAAVRLLGEAPWNLFALKALGALLRGGRGSRRPDGVPQVHAIGDSHSVHMFTVLPDIAVTWLGPRTMHRVGRDPLDLAHLGVRPGDRAIFVFGEIDARCHVARVAGVRTADGADAQPVVDRLAARYIRSLRRSADALGGVSITVCGVPPAAPSGSGSAAAPAFPLAGSPGQRAGIARRLNDALRAACAAAGFGFLDIHALYADGDGFLRAGDSDGLVHIRYDRVAPIAAELGLPVAIPFRTGWSGHDAERKRALDIFEKASALLWMEAWDGLLTEAERLLARDGSDPRPWFFKARALGKLGHRDEALAAVRNAVAIDPRHVDSLVQQGNLLYQAGALAEAAVSFNAAREIAPDDSRVLSWLALTLWEMAECGEAKEVAIASHDRIRTPPFRFAQLALFCEVLDVAATGPSIRRAADRVWARATEIDAADIPARSRAGRRLRVGAHCSFFHIQSGRRFILPQLEAVPSDRIDLVLIGGDFGRTAIDRFPTVSLKELKADRNAMVEAIRKLDLDVLIDYDGPTEMYEVWARRVAPVQLAAYNYPFQSGLPTMDGYVSEELIVPPGQDHLFTERVRRLSCPTYAFRIPQAWRTPTPLPAKANGFVTFGFFGNPIKLGPSLLRWWAEVMNALPGSRLHLGHGDYHRGTMPAVWRKRLEDAGLPVDRVDFLPGVDAEEIGQRYTAIDIALDPYPYNGGHTTMEALCFGAPTISYCGDRLISRHGLAYLTHAGLPELVARNPGEYVAKLVALARDTERLEELRRTLADRIAASALCDLPAVGRAWAEVLEAAHDDAACRKADAGT